MNEHKLAKLVIDRDKILNDFNKDCKTIKELKDLTDWNKQQPNGEYFGGFWNDKSCSNASVLTRQHNFDELIKLPYSRKLICETIDIGCCNRIESVRFTNYVCEWIKRKKNI